jgi:hypothetical protein
VGNARGDRKVKPKLGGKTIFLCRYLYASMYIRGSGIGPLTQSMPACHLGTMDRPVATSAGAEPPIGGRRAQPPSKNSRITPTTVWAGLASAL